MTFSNTTLAFMLAVADAMAGGLSKFVSGFVMPLLDRATSLNPDAKNFAGLLVGSGAAFVAYRMLLVWLL